MCTAGRGRGAGPVCQCCARSRHASALSDTAAGSQLIPAMPLPPATTRLRGLRELEPKCADRESPAARRTVRQLREESQHNKEAYTRNCTIFGLPNLVRCATEAGVSADTRFPHNGSPVLRRCR
jgi:hypothetical protein